MRATSRNRGFSLIELIVVMAIIAAMALVASPWFLKLFQRNTMKSAAQEMSITFAAARMRAVKRNRPAEVRITIATPSQPYHLIETFELVQPVELKVAESRMTDKVFFPPPALLPICCPNPLGTPLTARFNPDGRSTVSQWFTIRGPLGAGTPNNLTVSILRSGKINVLGPNFTDLKPLGTEWH